MKGKQGYKRVMLKLSGEAFLGSREYGIDLLFTSSLAREIKEVKDLGVEVAVVVGGGNIFRGTAGEKHGMDRATGDYMGMIATVINALALQDALEKIGVDTRVQTAIAMHNVAEPFIRRRAIRHMEKGRVIILAAGTGDPYFTTDTTAALRALELHCEVILKATKVEGVFDKDPRKNGDAKKFEHLTFLQVLNNPEITIMDSSAVSLAMDNKIPIIVFNLLKKGNLQRVVLGEKIGTLVNDRE